VSGTAAGTREEQTTPAFTRGAQDGHDSLDGAVIYAIDYLAGVD
jgi:hypothetical protein